jgi:hypothetical protein
MSKKCFSVKARKFEVKNPMPKCYPPFGFVFRRFKEYHREKRLGQRFCVQVVGSTAVKAAEGHL